MIVLLSHIYVIQPVVLIRTNNVRYYFEWAYLKLTFIDLIGSLSNGVGLRVDMFLVPSLDHSIATATAYITHIRSIYTALDWLNPIQQRSKHQTKSNFSPQPIMAAPSNRYPIHFIPGSISTGHVHLLLHFGSATIMFPFTTAKYITPYQFKSCIFQ